MISSYILPLNINAHSGFLLAISEKEKESYFMQNGATAQLLIIPFMF
jgi:hypothetical protein